MHRQSIELLLADATWLRGLARRLVGSPDLAADLQQDVAVAALAAPATRGIGRGWLASVAHNLAALARRRSTREGRRLRQLAPPEPAPATADLVAAAELQQRAMAAVLALPPGYRDTVLLRFAQGLSLEQTARHLGVPLETVRTRQKRALTQLRARLRSNDGPRGRAWLLAIGIAMKAKHVVAAAAALVLLGLGSSPWWSPSLAPQPPDPLAAQAQAAAGRGGADDLAAPPEAGARSEVAPAAEVAPTPSVAPATTGAVVVSITWDDDGTPAAARTAWCREPSGPATFAVTDAEGKARFEGLAAGPHFVGTTDMRGVALAVAPGAVAEAALTLARGFSVRGRVVDPDDVPVPGAEIFVQHQGLWPAWVFPCGYTDAQGRFAVDGVLPDHAIAARERHLGVSDGELLGDGARARARDEVVLRLPRTGFATLRGCVVDAGNRPVRDAWVQVQPSRHVRIAPDGSMRVPPPAVVGRSDDAGRFAAEWLPPGQHTLYVYRRGFAPQRRQLALAALEPADVVVRLAPGAGLTGTVHDKAGRPVAGAMVQAVGLQVPQVSWLQTGPEGAFRFADLPPGELELAVVHPEYSRVVHRLEVAGDQQHTWNCVLGDERRIRGRLLDHLQAPLAGWYVQRPGSDRFAQTDADGAFVCTDCKQGHNTLLVRPGLGFEPVRARFDVEPDGPEQTFVVPADAAPSAHVRGQCLAADGTPLPDAVLNLHQDELYVHNRTRSAGDGTFDCGPLPPGRYRVIPTHAACRFDPVDVELRPHEHLELTPMRGRGVAAGR